MWIAIAKAGAESLFKGRSITYSTGRLDETVSNYDPRYHEAPVCLGDPYHDAPARGWVKALKREGSRLLAQVEFVDPQLKEEIQRGTHFKKIIEVYPANMALKRVRLYGPDSYRDALQYNEGGDSMFFEEDEKNANPGDILTKKIAEFLANPPRIDKYGHPIDLKTLNYRRAFEIVCEQNPELTERYIKYLEGLKKKAGRETVL